MRRGLLISFICVGCISFEPIQKSTAPFCAPTETVCDGLDDDCDGSIDEGLVVDCSNCLGNGARTCENGAFTQCNAPATSAEVCNGVDDDCDGEVDGIEQACTTCMGSGTETCVAGAWLNCTAPPGVAETCNDEDDDCDGAIDEDLVEQCSTACGVGMRACMGGVFGACSATSPVTETCNNLDDDCNGSVDNGVTQPCNDCRGAGTQTCTAGAWGTCSTAPTGETCNNVDDDCVGGVDNGLTQVCSACRGSGTQTCAAGVWSTCSTAPTGETCNGLDDDCVGGADNFTRGCTDCRGAGTELCTAGAWGTCSTAPVAETCNGVDDNCVNGVDEGFNTGAACDSGDADTCANGVIACGAFGGTGCSGDVAPAIYDFCALCNATYTPGNIGMFGNDSPAIAWSGTHYGVAYKSGDDIRFVRVDANGGLVSSSINLSNSPGVDSKAPSVAWNGTHWGVTWMEAGTAIPLARVTAAGALAEAPVDVGAEVTSRERWFPQVEWSPANNTWTVFFECGANIEFADSSICRRRVTATLGSDDPPLGMDAAAMISGLRTREISLARNGSSLAMAYNSKSGEVIYACLLNAGWTGCNTNVALTSNLAGAPWNPQIAWNGTEYRIFWHDQRGSPPDKLYSVELHADGATGFEDGPVVAGNVARFADVIWNGATYLVVMEDTVAGDDELRISRVDSSGSLIGSQRLTSRAGYDWRPTIALGSNGSALVGFVSLTGGTMIQPVRCGP